MNWGTYLGNPSTLQHVKHEIPSKHKSRKSTQQQLFPLILQYVCLRVAQLLTISAHTPTLDPTPYPKRTWLALVRAAWQTQEDSQPATSEELKLLLSSVAAGTRRQLAQRHRGQVYPNSLTFFICLGLFFLAVSDTYCAMLRHMDTNCLCSLSDVKDRPVLSLTSGSVPKWTLKTREITRLHTTCSFCNFILIVKYYKDFLLTDTAKLSSITHVEITVCKSTYYVNEM